MLPKPLIIIDFDSTFIKRETLDVLAEIVFADSPERNEMIARISELTQLAMTGHHSFYEALFERIKYLNLKRQHINAVIALLKDEVSTSFVNNKWLIQKLASHIYIFSGGFDEVIVPIVAEFGIPKHQVYANRFMYAEDNDTIIHIDSERLMAHGDGKAKQLAAMMPTGKVYVIGDGSTDAITKNTGLVTTFYLFAENVLREPVAAQADKIIYSLEPFFEDLSNDVDFLPKK